MKTQKFLKDEYFVAAAERIAKPVATYSADRVVSHWGAIDETPARPIRLDGISILVADDSPDNQKLFHRVLTMAGAQVDLAGEGDRATKMASEKAYSVIILDICMPVMDGYRAAGVLRERGYMGPILALTALDQTGEEERCLNAGFDSYHMKPIDRMGLLRAVSDALGDRIHSVDL